MPMYKVTCELQMTWTFNLDAQDSQTAREEAVGLMNENLPVENMNIRVELNRD